MELNKEIELKVFISQPMRGLKNKEIRRVRKNVESKVTDVVRNVNDEIKPFHIDVKFIDSFFEGHTETETPVYLLSKAIECMSGADLVVFVNDWYDARGCCIEHEICEQYNIPCIEVVL